ncbi:hypothetical protein GCM10017784_17970 [Deinococcus indicus]|nr:hypothetical protein GCM10017784_17970 [Deinococcus indicus]
MRLPRAVIHDVQAREQVERGRLLPSGDEQRGVREALTGQVLVDVLQNGTRGGNMSEKVHAAGGGPGMEGGAPTRGGAGGGR